MFHSEDIGRYICRWVAKSAKKAVIGPPIFRWMEYPRFRTCIFKLHLLPTMWPNMVEFRSASSEISWRNKKEESVVKYESPRPRLTMSGGLIMTNRKSTTGFPTSYRWSAYVTANHQRVAQKAIFVVFWIKVNFSRIKSSLLQNSFLCENFKRQSCSMTTPLSDMTVHRHWRET